MCMFLRGDAMAQVHHCWPPHADYPHFRTSSSLLSRSWSTRSPYSSVSPGLSTSRCRSTLSTVASSSSCTPCSISIPRLGFCRPSHLPVACQCKCSARDSDGDVPIEVLPESLFGFCLHNLMDQAGLDTAYARVARDNFTEEIAKLRKPSNKDGAEGSLDLAKAALEIAAEDDALVTHSSVALPVDSYINRLESMAVEFRGHYLPSRDRSPLAIFEALDNYMYGYKGFQRTKSVQTGDARVYYLNAVLTTRLGTPVMLALIYSELVKRLQRMSVIDFSVDMELPLNVVDLPHSRVASQIGSTGGNHHSLLLTPQLLLVEVLRSLKQLYWPWRAGSSTGEGTGFLQAAAAASRGTGMNAPTSPFESLFNAPSSSRGAEVAGARAAQLRLQRGIWTSTSFGDLRRALAASERLVLLGVDKRELRDYGMLLFHSGLHERAFDYLNAYSTSQASATVPSVFNPLEVEENAALERLLVRLRLILAEQAWTGKPTSQFSSSELPPDPW